ncbi:MAG TPA: hypothetical protein VL981_07490 [Candidatus Methylacidiphilales bacterium]|nr:hypothetical protein [Candidatus Methylacidiphilales bacterium]
MKSSRLFVLIVTGCCFLHGEPIWAQNSTPAYIFPKQFSADEIVTTKRPNDIETRKTYVDKDKIRWDVGDQAALIFRMDQQKLYIMLPSQKKVTVRPLTSPGMKMSENELAVSSLNFGDNTKVEEIGSEPLDGVATDRYKLTLSDGKAPGGVGTLWINAAKQSPIKFTSDDGALTIEWKNFQPGSQDAALFEPPADYQVINVPDDLYKPKPLPSEPMTAAKALDLLSPARHVADPEWFCWAAALPESADYTPENIKTANLVHQQFDAIEYIGAHQIKEGIPNLIEYLNYRSAIPPVSSPAHHMGPGDLGYIKSYYVAFGALVDMPGAAPILKDYCLDEKNPLGYRIATLHALKYIDTSTFEECWSDLKKGESLPSVQSYLDNLKTNTVAAQYRGVPSFK